MLSVADELTQWLDEIVYPRLTHEVVFGELPDFRAVGPGRYECRCPSHDDKGRPNFSMTDGVPAGHCFRCGHVRSWWAQIEGRVGPGRAVIEELARLAGVPPLGTGGDGDRSRAARERSQVLEEVLLAGRRALFQSDGADVLTYLRTRGYPDEIIGKTELAAWPPTLDTDMKKHLALGLPGAGTTHRLIIPARSASGNLVGLILRYVGDVPDGARKFLVPLGFERGSVLPGFAAARRQPKETPLLVEGWLDGEILRAHGIPAVTIGAAELTKEQHALLRGSRLPSVLLCLDDDRAGSSATAAAARELLREGPDGRTMRVYVAPPLNSLDPDEWATKFGADAFRSHLRSSISAAVWYVHRCFEGLDPQDVSARDSAFDAACDFAETLPPIARAEAVAALSAASGIPTEALDDELLRRDERRRAREARARVEKLGVEIRAVMDNNPAPAALRAQVRQAVAEADHDLARITLKPAPSYAEVFNDTSRQLENWPEGLTTPWPMVTKVGVTFEPGTFNVVAAQTSGGKTTLLMQSLIAWLRRAERPLVLWSCETTQRVLMARLLAMLATEKADGRREYSMWQVVRQIRAGRLDAEVLDARRELQALASGLYHLDDGTLTAADFREACGLLARKHGGLTAIMVDYLQAMDPSDQLLRSREEEVARTVKELTWAAGLSAGEGAQLAERFEVPVVAAAQFNRNLNFTPDLVPQLEHLRESGRIEQSAFVVAGLRNATMSRDADPCNPELAKKAGIDLAALEARPAAPYSSFVEAEKSRLLARIALAREPLSASADSTEPPERPTLLELSVLKNRQRGHVGMIVPLVLHPRSGRITELEQTLTVHGGATAAGSSAGVKATPRPRRRARR